MDVLRTVALALLSGLWIIGGSPIGALRINYSDSACKIIA